MRIVWFGDSLIEGIPGISFLDALEAMLPQDTLLNCGKGGDTVISLCRRIAGLRVQQPMDVAVLWVGVNDVLANLSVSHSLLKQVTRQPRARDLDEFTDHYHRTLESLCHGAGHVLAVSPLFVGEDLTNPWNRELEDLCAAIASATTAFDTAQYVDLRSKLSERLPAGCASDYLPRRVAAIVRDALFLRTTTQVDMAASRRGLRLTLDGVHLNSEGARLVAAAFRDLIEDLRPRLNPGARCT